MPKDKFDFEDPMELNGVALLTDADTIDAMTECFIEEFMLMGYNHKQILALFRNPHYLGMNRVLQKRGEVFVKGVISDVFERWGRKIEWPASTPVDRCPLSPHPGPLHKGEGEELAACSPFPSAASGQKALVPPATAEALFPLPEGEGQGEGQGERERSVEHSCSCRSGSCSSTPSERRIALDENSPTDRTTRFNSATDEVPI
jgi:hypothetical protein